MKLQTYIRYALPVLLLMIPSLTVAQPTAPTPHCVSGARLGSVTLTVEGRASTATAAGPGIHWVVVMLPAEADIDVPDAALKTAIMDWVARQNSLPAAERHEWVLDGRNNANLFKSNEASALVPSLA